ncbi:hypothetical protein VDG1235_3384 [Verrucomicrobiia bacterium DG1235]|nr:hypothetical protein VDG1235_3384 [Verrucomicrobiae bacterium DG1235]
MVSDRQRGVLLAVALLALVGPNGMYLYYAVTQPELNGEALRNPVSLAFMIEAMMLLGLFLWYVFLRTRSWVSVMAYLVLAFAGSLAFSFPMFLYRQLKNGKA